MWVRPQKLEVKLICNVHRSIPSSIHLGSFAGEARRTSLLQRLLLSDVQKDCLLALQDCNLCNEKILFS